MGVIRRIGSNTVWEPVFGYSRAVKAGEWLVVSGTTGIDERGSIAGVGQMYAQAKQALLNIKAHVERAGLSLGDIVRTRVFVTDITRFAEVARAHKEIMGDAPPASTLVEVCRLVHPDMLVEIEADAYAGDARSRAGVLPASPAPTPAPAPSASKAPGAKARKPRRTPSRKPSRSKPRKRKYS